jgi:hypothetical protein
MYEVIDDVNRPLEKKLMGLDIRWVCRRNVLTTDPPPSNSKLNSNPTEAAVSRFGR